MKIRSAISPSFDVLHEKMQMNGQGKIAKQIGAKGFYARVNVHCDVAATGTAVVSLDPIAENALYRSQGWTDAALAGAAFGLKLANLTARCRVTQIHGMPGDTNATLVAIAAIRAVWAALEFKPDTALDGRLESLITRRSEISVADLERILGESPSEREQ